MKAALCVVLSATFLSSFVGGCAAGSNENEMQKATPVQHTAKPTLATAKEFCNAEAEAACSDAVVAACDVTGGKNECVKKRSTACVQAIPQGTTYQPGKAPACLSAVKSAYATGELTATSLSSLDPACGADLFAGPGLARSPCRTDYDCDSSKKLRCVLPSPPPIDDMGQCFVPQIVEPGGDCSPQGSVCGTNTYCDPTGLTCMADAQVGDGCNPPYYPCAPGLACPAAGSPFATCSAASADGAACTADDQCASGMCDKATDQAGGTCATTIVLSSLDSLCQSFR